MNNVTMSKIFKRLLIVSVLAGLFVGGISEVTYRLRKDDTDRTPEIIELIIPAGTAASIEDGATGLDIPDEMVFVVGDVLKVINNDSVDHQFGPLFIPAGTSASIQMEEANKYAYNCSFKATKYLGLNVRPRTTLASRAKALLLASPPTAMFFLVYSLLLFPLDKKAGSDSILKK